MAVAIDLVIEEDGGILSPPIISVICPNEKVPGLLEIVGRLTAYIPIRAVMAQSVVTSLVYTDDAVTVAGTPVTFRRVT